ncbi:MAG: IclR family transcriptional regulator [Nocardioides sp.]
MAAETSQTLDRGCRVLRVLADTPDGLSVTELASTLGVNRTVTYRLVSTLEQHGLVRRDARGRLFIGLGIVHLAAAVQPALRDLAVPLLRGLADEVGCTAFLAVADGGEVLALAVVEPSWTVLHVAYRVGARHPMPHGGSGPAIQLGRDRSQLPFVVSDGVQYPGVRSLAAPVRGVPGLEASVGVLSLGDEVDADTLGPPVVAAAEALSARIR